MKDMWLQSESLLTAQERAKLLQEAQKERPVHGQRNERPGWRIVDGRQFLGPARFSYCLTGDSRLAIQQKLAERASELLGLRLEPVQSNYLYYEHGDFLGLHHDQQRCPYTIVALLEGEAEPLCLHPEQMDTPPGELAPLLDPDGHRGGLGVSLADGPLLIAGTLVPHHRDPHLDSGTITIGTFCFAPAAHG